MLITAYTSLLWSEHFKSSTEHAELEVTKGGTSAKEDLQETHQQITVAKEFSYEKQHSAFSLLS